jgi:hypothetical protein
MLVFSTIKTLFMKRIIFIVLLFACQKEYTIHATEEGTANMAFLKVIAASPNFVDTFNISIDGEKVNGAGLKYGSMFPITGYMAIKPGLRKIGLGDAYSVDKQLEAGKRYTFMITDAVRTAARDSARILVEDAFVNPSAGSIRMRFIHAVMNDTADKKVDLFSYAKNGKVVSAISPDSVGAYITLGINLQTADTFYVTRGATAGTPLSGRIVLAKLAFNSSSISGAGDRRCFTLYYRGDGNVTSGTKARTLAGYVH